MKTKVILGKLTFLIWLLLKEFDVFVQVTLHGFLCLRLSLGPLALLLLGDLESRQLFGIWRLCLVSFGALGLLLIGISCFLLLHLN